MTETAVEYDEAPTQAPRSSLSDVRSLLAAILGGLVLLMWVGLFVGSLLGLGEEGTRLLSDVLLGTCVLAAISALVCAIPAGIVALLGTGAFAGAWYYIGWSLTYAVDDLIYYGVIAAFYLAPPIVGLAAIFAARSRSRRLSLR